MTAKLSVVICSYNPRLHFLKRVLSALQGQTLSMSEWELLLIDNASFQPLDEQVDLSWHPSGRHMREEQLGLTPARLRGVAEAKGEILIFVDDDNVLCEGYLAQAAAIAEHFPFLGAWGGSIELEFEMPPPQWIVAYRSHLAFREFRSSRWSNIKSDLESQPYGAGMCLRRSVCAVYAEKIANDEFRRSLDRKGASLLAGGDIDLVLCAADLGLGWGNFPELRLIHLIPPTRVEEKYLLRLREAVIMSNAIIAGMNGFSHAVTPQWKYTLQRLWRRARYGRRFCLFMDAERRGHLRGLMATSEYIKKGEQCEPEKRFAQSKLRP